MTGSAGTAMDVVLRRRKAYKGGSLREGGSKIPLGGRLADSQTHGKSRVQINSQIRGTDQGILIKTGVQINYGRSESGHNSMRKK